ncbi:MAG: M48 family metalloprotease [bacterium]|nr:M48 family metalloprotease [bacterium]
MGEFWFRFTLSNVCVSSAIAIVAFAMQRRGRQPLLAHLLWLGVLLKLVTPPLFTVPVIPVAVSSAVAGESFGVEGLEATSAAGAVILADEVSAPAAYALPVWRALGWVWFWGSLIVLAVSLHQLGAFRRSLRRASRPAPADVQRMSDRLGASLELRRVPEVITTAAHVTPFVWWLGGPTQVVLPREALDSLSTEELRLLLAHELAHVRRRDHWVRWVEWLAGVAFWWNPVMWWARRNLRVSEELACDALVLQSFDADRHTYADALLSAAELLAGTALRPPAVASAIHSGGSLEQRLTMIISDKLPQTPRWLRTIVLAVTVGLLPMSLAYAQDFGAIERRLGQAVAAGEITLDHAQVMMEALRKAAGKGKVTDREAVQRRSRQEYVDAEKKIEAAVAKGELSKKEAERKLVQVRKELFGEPQKDADMEGRRRRYAEAQRKIKEAVKTGRASKEDGERRLIALRKKLFGEPRKEADMEARRRRYEGAQRRVEEGIKAGKISSTDGEKRLIALRKELFGDSEKDADTERRKQSYKKAQREIEEQVKSGKLSKEDAEKRLIELRVKLFPRKSSDR